MATPAEAAAMRRAIALSAAGLGTTSPNPPVGCVLLDAQGRIIGEEGRMRIRQFLGGHASKGPGSRAR